MPGWGGENFRGWGERGGQGLDGTGDMSGGRGFGPRGVVA